MFQSDVSLTPGIPTAGAVARPITMPVAASTLVSPPRSPWESTSSALADAISLVREPAFDLSRRGALQRLAERGEDPDTEAARTIANVCAALMAAPAPASQ